MKNNEDLVRKLIVHVHCYDTGTASIFVSHLKGHNQRKTSDDFKNIIQDQNVVEVTCTCVVDALLILPFYKLSISERFDITFDRYELTSYYRTARIDVKVEFRNLRCSVLFYQTVAQVRSVSESAYAIGEAATDGYGVSVTFYDWDTFYCIDKFLLSVESSYLAKPDKEYANMEDGTDRTPFIISIIAILMMIGFAFLGT